MASKIMSASGAYDVSKINNLKDLREEIAFLKNAIDKEEDALEHHFRGLPGHLLKSTADNLLPGFLNKLIANGAWKILLSSLAVFANPFSRKSNVKKSIWGSAKRIGLIALVKTGYNLLMNKHSEKTSPAAGVKRPDVTTLKTKHIKKG